MSYSDLLRQQLRVTFPVKAASDKYYKALLHPWGPQSKIPFGFPVRSSLVQYSYKIPWTSLGTALTIGTNAYVLTVAGSPVLFTLQPNNNMDASDAFKSSHTTVGLTYFTNHASQLTSKGLNANFSSVRLISAGIRHLYTSAPIYKRGLVFFGSSNARVVGDYGVGAAAAALFKSDVSTHMGPIDTSFQLVYHPVDFDSLNFQDVNVTAAHNNEWIGWINFENYDSVNGASGIFDIVLTYECIPTGVFEPISGATDNPGGTDGDVTDAFTPPPADKDPNHPEDNNILSSNTEPDRFQSWDRFGSHGGY